MKEATGELNMTVVTVVAIGALVAFFYFLIWPAIQTGMALQSACSSAGNATMTFKDDDNNDSIICAGGTCTIAAGQTGAGTSKACDQ